MHRLDHTSDYFAAAPCGCRPAASLSATVDSTSPAQTLRELASSVPDDRRPYRVSVQIEPQDSGTTPR
ncbi:hypothetical protein [Burkholderia sp. WP9]|uniref:hypothetical protein n=1 Tax=Burkholderia sp. WP9 TaxID=1500263 RepID=UPI000B80D675|nr:hypothetical protein [Burkholderia sp. WP9]